MRAIGFIMNVSLAQANNLAIHKINAVCLWNPWQARHADDITCNGNNHLGTGVKHYIANLKIEILHCTILGRIGTE